VGHGVVSRQCFCSTSVPRSVGVIEGLTGSAVSPSRNGGRPEAWHDNNTGARVPTLRDCTEPRDPFCGKRTGPPGATIGSCQAVRPSSPSEDTRTAFPCLPALRCWSYVRQGHSPAIPLHKRPLTLVGLWLPRRQSCSLVLLHTGGVAVMAGDRLELPRTLLRRISPKRRSGKFAHSAFCEVHQLQRLQLPHNIRRYVGSPFGIPGLSGWCYAGVHRPYIVGLLVCLLAKSPREEGRTLWATTHEEEDQNEP